MTFPGTSGHWPVLASRGNETWGVFCSACSNAAGDYVYPCGAGHWAETVPPVVAASVQEPTQIRLTPRVCAVLAVLLSDPEKERYAREISKATGVEGTTVIAIMTRLAALGWLVDRWEQRADGRAKGHVLRHYYRLAAEHVAPVRALLAARAVELVARHE